MGGRTEEEIGHGRDGRLEVGTELEVEIERAQREEVERAQREEVERAQGEEVERWWGVEKGQVEAPRAISLAGIHRGRWCLWCFLWFPWFLRAGRVLQRCPAPLGLFCEQIRLQVSLRNAARIRASK